MTYEELIKALAERHDAMSALAEDGGLAIEVDDTPVSFRNAKGAVAIVASVCQMPDDEEGRVAGLLLKASALMAASGYGAFVMDETSGEISIACTLSPVRMDLSNYSLHNLRIIKKTTNDRDGGFLRMLRNRGIDPTMYDQSFLLRFFKRMARKKKLKPWKYNRLTRDDLLTMLVSPEYRVGPPLDPAAEPTKHYDPFCERDDPDSAAHLAPFSL